MEKTILKQKWAFVVQSSYISGSLRTCKRMTIDLRIFVAFFKKKDPLCWINWLLYLKLVLWNWFQNQINTLSTELWLYRLVQHYAKDSTCYVNSENFCQYWKLRLLVYVLVVCIFSTLACCVCKLRFGTCFVVATAADTRNRCMLWTRSDCWLTGLWQRVTTALC